MTLISNIPITCTAWLVDLLELRPSKSFLVGPKHVADTYYGGSRCYTYVKQQYIAVNCTEIYFHGWGKGWLGGAGLSGNKANLSPTELI